MILLISYHHDIKDHMASYNFDNADTKTRWNQCANECTAGAAADPPMYYHCNRLFLCRAKSDGELNWEGHLDSVKVEPPGKPLVVSHEVITINKKPATCFYISNARGLFDKKTKLKNRMEYCIKRDIGQFVSCPQEVDDFKDIMKANKADTKKRKVTVEAEALHKRWKEEAGGAKPANPSPVSRPEPSYVNEDEIYQRARVVNVEIPLGTLLLHEFTLFVKLNSGWEVLSTGISAGIL